MKQLLDKPSFDGVNLEKDLKKYAKWGKKVWFSCVEETKISPEMGDLFVMTLGLGGEVGEVADAMVSGDQNAIKNELSDVIYYWAMLALFHQIKIESLTEQAASHPKKHTMENQLIDLFSWTSKTQEIIKKSVRDGTADRSKLTDAMGNALAAWCHLTKSFEWEPKDIFEASVDKIIKRISTCQMRGSDEPDGRRIAPGAK